MPVDDYQLHPARTPDRCPACGARSAPKSACVSCGYRSSRALWRREYSDRAAVLRAIVEAVTPLMVLLVLCAIALIARSRFAIGLALVAALVTIARYAQFVREQRWAYDAVSVWWSYDDPSAGVSARGPCPLIEGVPFATYRRRTSDAVELSSTDEARHETYRLLSSDAALSRAMQRLHELGAIRLYAQQFTSKLAPIDSHFPVAGLFRTTRHSVARGSVSPPTLEAMESKVLAFVDARAAWVESTPASYGALDAGPSAPLIAVDELRAACVAPTDERP